MAAALRALTNEVARVCKILPEPLSISLAWERADRDVRNPNGRPNNIREVTSWPKT